MILKNWNKLINTECVVLKLGQDFIYPIFRNGSTSLAKACDGRIKDNEITNCELITIFLQDPEKRFVSGVNEYCRQNNLDLEKTWQQIHDGENIDRHFAPQWIWLLHLYKWYKGDVSLKPLSALKNYCGVHTNRSPRNKPVALLKNFVEIDLALLEHINEIVPLSHLVKEYKNVLS